MKVYGMAIHTEIAKSNSHFFTKFRALDLVVEDQVIVELKAVSELLPVHEAGALYLI